MAEILIVEDEEAIAELIKLNLTKAGHRCEYRLDGESGADAVEAHDYDLILLDIMLPEISGYELLEYILPMNIPVMFITAKGTVKDRIKGLRMGADDYIVKPFDADEMVARVETVLRRYGKSGTVLKAKDVTLNLQSKEVMKGEMSVMLTPKEYELLLVLMRNKNIAMYREELFEKVWDTEFTGDSRTLDLHIQRLRKKLDWKDVIKTVYKMGYMLEDK